MKFYRFDEFNRICKILDIHNIVKFNLMRARNAYSTILSVCYDFKYSNDGKPFTFLQYLINRCWIVVFLFHSFLGLTILSLFTNEEVFQVAKSKTAFPKCILPILNFSPMHRGKIFLLLRKSYMARTYVYVHCTLYTGNYSTQM